MYLPMEANQKVLYEAPSIAVVEVRAEGIVCQSLKDYNYGGLDEDD